MVQFCPSESFMKKVEHVRHLASHRLPADATLEQIFELALDAFIERVDPVARKQRREARGKQAVASQPASQSASQSDNARQIPAALRDEVFERDQGRCTFTGPRGQRCGSKHMLQIDHRVPVARGGESTLENLRLLCAYHNRLESERVMGRSGPKAGAGATATAQATATTRDAPH